MKNLANTHFDQYVELFNSQGKVAAIEYITQECNMDYLAFQRKLRSKSNYVYDRGAKKYRVRDNEDQFMSLEELCTTKVTSTKMEIKANANRDKLIFDTIVIDLMKDRLSEIAKYIVFEQSSKEIHINSERLQRDGYTLTIN
ncbi:hypothetical protein [Desulfosporosinus sp. OT]|uniref:hypothetical protein n=1 Tax=Desulfosporosinus sp. OT TaxID=913865 RepID=UPI0005905729|nr:hypothetical protein [Desulfosporosinus sp. OT]